MRIPYHRILAKSNKINILAILELHHTYCGVLALLASAGLNSTWRWLPSIKIKCHFKLSRWSALHLAHSKFLQLPLNTETPTWSLDVELVFLVLALPCSPKIKHIGCFCKGVALIKHHLSFLHVQTVGINCIDFTSLFSRKPGLVPGNTYRHWSLKTVSSREGVGGKTQKCDS